MICQYCGHKLTDGKCLNPACPGRLRPTGESSNGATSGQDSTLLGPAPVEVERLVDDLLSVSKQLGQSEARGLYDHIEPAEVAINDLKSRLLAALSNTTPYLSQDVSVPVAQDDCIERIISYVDEYINDQIDRVVLKSEIGLVLDDIFYSYLQKGG